MDSDGIQFFIPESESESDSSKYHFTPSQLTNTSLSFRRKYFFFTFIFIHLPFISTSCPYSTCCLLWEELVHFFRIFRFTAREWGLKTRLNESEREDQMKWNCKSISHWFFFKHFFTVILFIFTLPLSLSVLIPLCCCILKPVHHDFQLSHSAFLP